MYETFDDIQALLGVASESHELEFKRGDELDAIDQDKTKAELVRDASAFANAGGGTIIYGIEEDKGSPPLASGIFPVSNDRVTDLRLTQIIRTGLEPVFNKFSVRQIDVPGGGRIFIVSVDRADTAHQCKSDQRYYHRVGVHRPAMFDYEIRDVMNRRSAPAVRLDYSIHTIERNADRHVYWISPNLVNEGGLTAGMWALEVIAIESSADNQAGAFIQEKARLRGHPLHRVWEFSCERNATGRRAVLLPGQSLALDQTNGYGMIKAIVTDESFRHLQRERPPIIFRLYVDNCPMAETIVPFGEWCDY